MVQQSSLDNDFTHAVLRDTNEGWRDTFEAAEDYQASNPAVMAAALAAPCDHIEGGRALVPALATMHPLVIRRCLAYLDFINAALDELAHPDLVAPQRDHVFVVRGTDASRQPDDTRLAELEAENAELRQALEQALRQQEADRTSMDAAVTVLRMRLEGIG